MNAGPLKLEDFSKISKAINQIQSLEDQYFQEKIDKLKEETQKISSRDKLKDSYPVGEAAFRFKENVLPILLEMKEYATNGENLYETFKNKLSKNGCDLDDLVKKVNESAKIAYEFRAFDMTLRSVGSFCAAGAGIVGLKYFGSPNTTFMNKVSIIAIFGGLSAGLYCAKEAINYGREAC